MALTKRDLDRLEYDPQGPTTQIVYDGSDLPGFGVRVFPSGVKSFVVWYRTGKGKKRLHTVGKYGPFTIQQARDLARKALLEAKTGADPLEERREARRGDTVRDFASVYIERHAKKHKKSWRDDQRRLNTYVIPALGQRKLADVKRSDVARLHGNIGDTKPYEANRVLALLAVAFNKAAEWGYLPEEAPNPAVRVQRFREKSRDRWVKPNELPELLKAIEAEPNIYIRAAFKLYLLTGLRRSELLGLQWKDVDFTRKELRLEDTKAGRSHVVPLSAPAIEIFRSLPKQLGNPYVLPGQLHGRPLVNVAKPWGRIRKAAGLEAVRLHDLRRTVGSWMAAGGASLPLIGKVLNHSNASTTQVYARLAEDAAREVLEKHGARIGPLLSVLGGAEPVPKSDGSL